MLTTNPWKTLDYAYNKSLFFVSKVPCNWVIWTLLYVRWYLRHVYCVERFRERLSIDLLTVRPFTENQLSGGSLQTILVGALRQVGIQRGSRGSAPLRFGCRRWYLLKVTLPIFLVLSADDALSSRLALPTRQLSVDTESIVFHFRFFQTSGGACPRTPLVDPFLSEILDSHLNAPCIQRGVTYRAAWFTPRSWWRCSRWLLLKYTT